MYEPWVVLLLNVGWFVIGFSVGTDARKRWRRKNDRG